MNRHATIPTCRRRGLTTALALSLLLAPALALAQHSGTTAPSAKATASLPAWDSLTPAQRELLIAPIRERWNANPDNRSRMYQHAQRWHEMSPEQRARARHGQRRWEGMDPGKRQQMRALYQQMRGMDKAGREALRKQWQEMSDAERRAWVEAHPPSRD